MQLLAMLLNTKVWIIFKPHNYEGWLVDLLGDGEFEWKLKISLQIKKNKQISSLQRCYEN